MNENGIKSPVISVIIPVYNTDKYLSKAIESVLNQTFVYWELLLIDDGSTDRSPEICREYARLDERIRVISTENKGVSHARNVGLKRANGEWIAFLDSDDLLRKDALEKLVKHNDDVDVVACAYETYPETEGNRAVRYVKHYQSFCDTSELYETANQHLFFYTVWGKLYRRKKLSVVFDENVKHSEDEVFNLINLPCMNGICIIPDALYFYRKDDGRHTLSNKFWYDALEIRARIYVLTCDKFAGKEMVLESAFRELCAVVMRYVFTISNMDTLKKQQKLIILNEVMNSAAVDIIRRSKNHPEDELWNAMYFSNVKKAYRICKTRFLLKKTKCAFGRLKGMNQR